MGAKYTKRSEDYSKWYNELVERADLAEHSDVRGCMVIKPHGYSIWENMKEALDKKFKAFNFKVDFSKYPKYNFGRKSGKDANIIKRKKSIKDFLDE